MHSHFKVNYCFKVHNAHFKVSIANFGISTLKTLLKGCSMNTLHRRERLMLKKRKTYLREADCNLAVQSGGFVASGLGQPNQNS